jgi:soluble lytic murein transglycosylase-like protein
LTAASRTRRDAAALGMLWATLCAPALAAWDCVDAFGHRYVVAHEFGQSADVRCAPIDEPELVAQVVATTEPATGTMPAPSVPASVNGRLVLAAASQGSAAQLDARRRQVDPLIEATAREFSLDADLLRAVVQVESRFDPGAISPRGAIGLMQVMPSTAGALGLARPEQSLLEPRANLRTGARYLRQLSVQFAGATDLVLAAYNAGESSVLRNGLAVPPYPETQAYVRDVLEIYRTLRASR